MTRRVHGNKPWGGQFWTPITPDRGSIFHADQQLRRLRQDHHARPSSGARGEEGLPLGGPGTLGVGGADAGVRGRHRERDPAALPRAQRRRRRGPSHEEGGEGDARRLRENDPGGRRGLARFHRAGPRPPADRERAPTPPRGAGGRRQAARRRRCRQALRPAPGRRDEDRHDGRDHAPARSGAEGRRSRRASRATSDARSRSSATMWPR